MMRAKFMVYTGNYVTYLLLVINDCMHVTYIVSIAKSKQSTLHVAVCKCCGV